MKEKLIPTSEFPHYSFSFEYFNDLQTESFKYFEKDCNLVVAGHICSGKTAIHEAIAAYELTKDKDVKIIYISPIKALANEKVNGWREDPFFKKYRLVELTSDSGVYKYELYSAKIIVATVEALNICYRRGDEWLKDVRLLTFDEAHLFDHEVRGAGAEALMMGISSMVDCRFLLLSGTMGNVVELARWIKKLNDKQTFYIDSDWRPTKLHKHVIEVNNYSEESNFVSKIIDADPSLKTLIFVHSKFIGEKLRKTLRNNGISCTFYHSGLTYDERNSILERFRSDAADGLKVLISTSALSMGVSL